ncbi:MAG: phosphomannose isomerase type II C-terminal cupin domain [Pseudomonadota bacterium]
MRSRDRGRDSDFARRPPVADGQGRQPERQPLPLALQPFVNSYNIRFLTRLFMVKNQIEPAGYIDHRPWGYYLVLADESDHKVKRIVLNQAQRISFQRHGKRSEHWFLVQGEALVTLNDRTIKLFTGQSIDIPRGAWHRVQNIGEANLSFIEVQTGEYFGEDDIERREDDYGRK